ncbi:MAG: hypothetical protein ACRD1N_05255, partial [Terriglobia bacterium]
MSNRTKWLLNLGVLALMLIYFFVGLYTQRWWIDVTVVGIFLVGGACYFVVQLVRFRGGNEASRPG